MHRAGIMLWLSVGSSVNGLERQHLSDRTKESTRMAARLRSRSSSQIAWEDRQAQMLTAVAFRFCGSMLFGGMCNRVRAASNPVIS
jgi:hypothetical protein